MNKINISSMLFETSIISIEDDLRLYFDQANDLFLEQGWQTTLKNSSEVVGYLKFFVEDHSSKRMSGSLERLNNSLFLKLTIHGAGLLKSKNAIMVATERVFGVNIETIATDDDSVSMLLTIPVYRMSPEVLLSKLKGVKKAAEEIIRKQYKSVVIQEETKEYTRQQWKQAVARFVKWLKGIDGIRDVKYSDESIWFEWNSVPFDYNTSEYQLMADEGPSFKDWLVNNVGTTPSRRFDFTNFSEDEFLKLVKWFFNLYHLWLDTKDVAVNDVEKFTEAVRDKLLVDEQISGMFPRGFSDPVIEGVQFFLEFGFRRVPDRVGNPVEISSQFDLQIGYNPEFDAHRLKPYVNRPAWIRIVGRNLKSGYQTNNLFNPETVVSFRLRHMILYSSNQEIIDEVAAIVKDILLLVQSAIKKTSS